MSIKPISPSEVKDKANQIPEYIIEVFNNLIARNFRNGKAIVFQKDVKQEIGQISIANITYEAIIANGWLDVEELYEQAGWTVSYDKPGYNESYDAYFVFSVKD